MSLFHTVYGVLMARIAWKIHLFDFNQQFLNGIIIIKFLLILGMGLKDKKRK